MPHVPSAPPGAPAGAAAVSVDVLIVGAGISGIGTAVHLQQQCPGQDFLVLEAQEHFGGTWHTHRFPGIRSDSDLYTFGYRFKPWVGPPIATAAEILHYLGEVVDAHALGPRIRYGHRVVRADWDGQQGRWTVAVQRAGQPPLQVSARFLWMCQGYYRHERPHQPTWPGQEAFRGQVVHPQHWPQDLDVRGKRLVVIGSGATAATLVPAVARDCAHVTLLQRSPTWFRTARNAIPIADELRQLGVDPAWIHEIVRRKILFEQAAFTRRTFEEPEAVATDLLGAVRACVGEDFDVERHFRPRYRPWRQRIAFVPDGDLFEAIRSGRASVVTDEIERFTPTGLALKSGTQLDADVVVTATGFDLSVLGDIAFTVDGAPVDFARTVTYHGLMFTGVPNLAWVFGYLRASWTLRVDLLGDFVCRLLRHMQARGARSVVPALRAGEETMPLGPWIDPENFNPGYLMRSLDRLPRCGDRAPWVHRQDYWTEKDELPAVDLEDGTLRYG